MNSTSLCTAQTGKLNCPFFYRITLRSNLFFKHLFKGDGVYLTLEVEDVDALYETLKEKEVPIEIELRDEPWGDRHFAIKDPNGIGIDIVKYTQPQPK